MKTIKELEADERLSYPTATVFENAPLALVQLEMETQINALKDVLGLIDERLKMLRDIMANSKAVNKNKCLMDVFKAGVRELEELKKRISG